MKISQVYAIAGALVLSSTAWAEGGGDRTFDRMMVMKDQAMIEYAARAENSAAKVMNTAAKEGKSALFVSGDAKEKTPKN